MENKDIIFIIPNLYNKGGMERVTIRIANEFSNKEKYNITIISIAHPKDTIYYKISDKVNIKNLSFKYFDIRKNFIKAAYELKQMFQLDFDGIFVIDDVGHNIPAWLGLKHCKKAKFISWSHTNFFNGSKYGFSGIGKRLAVKKFDYIVALTKEDKKYYKKILNAKNIVQIYNPKDSEIVKQAYAYESKKIISCGRLDKIKGFDLLIEVARDVFKNVDGWQWDIYGDGPEKDNLIRKIEEYGLTGKVNLKGYHTDILDLYKDYSFYVFTSRGEGCPMAMIEALTAGLPMISFDFKCGPKDLITNGVNGYIIKDWNITEMKDKVLELINNKELRINFAKNSDINLKELELPYVLRQWGKIL